MPRQEVTTIEDVDVLIVGAGPAGLSTALHLVNKDAAWAKRIVILEKSQHPRPKLCGGGVTHIAQNILARLGIPLEGPSVEISEVRLTYEDLRFSFRGAPVMRIVDRGEFDHWLARIGQECGIEIRENEPVISVYRGAEHVEVVTARQKYRAKVVVAADGSKSKVRSCLDWVVNERRANLIEVLRPESPVDREAFSQGIATFDFSFLTSGNLQGYYWDFPSIVRGDKLVNSGLFDSRAHKQFPKARLRSILDKALSKHGTCASDLAPKGHPILWWSKAETFATDRVLLVGDAAGVDPLLGEGISFALGYGEVAADTVSDAFAASDFSFDSYKIRLVRHGLFEHLDGRARAAKWLYRLRSRWSHRLIWKLAPLAVRRTEWSDPRHDPAEYPNFSLVEKVKQGARA